MAAAQPRVLIPSYFYPGDVPGAYLQIAEATEIAPVTAIINPCSGPADPRIPYRPNVCGEAQYTDYQRAVDTLRTASGDLRLVGYIATDRLSGVRADAEDVRDAIDLYAAYYLNNYSSPGAGGADQIFLDGLFFDETATNLALADDYRALCRYAKDAGLGRVILNPGTQLDPTYLSGGDCDVAVIFEDYLTGGRMEWSSYEIPDDLDDFPPERLGVLIHDASQTQGLRAAQTALERGFGFVYMTDQEQVIRGDDLIEDPWDEPSSYLEQLLEILAVFESNTAPSFTAVLSDQTVEAGIDFTFDYDAIDPEGDALSYVLDQGPGGALINQTNGLFSWTPSAAQAEQLFAVQVSVSDGSASTQTSATLTVRAPAGNTPPAFTDPVFALLAGPGESVLLDYDASDAEAGTLTFQLLDAPAGADIDADTGVLSWTASTAPDIYAFSVAVADEQGARDQVDLFVGVQGEIAPAREPDALRAELRDRYQAETLGYDRGRDTLYLRVSGFPDGVVEGIYTGYSVTLDPTQDPSSYLFARQINAEHIWPQSRGAGSEPQRSDMHILYPSRAQVNSARGNSPYAEIPDSETQTWYRLDQTATTIPGSGIDEWSERASFRFEPREEVEGDVARAMFYFAALYESAADQSFFAEQLETLLSWHVLDPPSAAEVLRSGLIERYQTNINPFVLDAGLAERAFRTGTSSAGGPESEFFVSEVWPNPSWGRAELTLQVSESQHVRVTLHDVLGREVAQVLDMSVPGGTKRSVRLALSGLPSGVYFVRAEGEKFSEVRQAAVVR